MKYRSVMSALLRCLPVVRGSSPKPSYTRILPGLLLLSLGATPALAQEAFRISAIPDEAPTELIRKFDPLVEYLSTALDRDVQFVPVTDYAATVEALVSDQVDMAWLGGFTYVQAAERSDGKVEPILQRVEDERFQSVFVTRRDSGIETVEDLAGVSFTFGSPSSTSGHLMPRYYLSKQGVDVENDLSIAFSGAHDATALAVAGGRVDAGALNIKVWEKLIQEQKIDTDEVHVFYTTPSYHDYNWTIRAGLSTELREALISAFLSLDAQNPEHKQILDLQRATRFIPSQAEHYNGILEAAVEADLLARR